MEESEREEKKIKITGERRSTDDKKIHKVEKKEKKEENKEDKEEEQDVIRNEERRKKTKTRHIRKEEVNKRIN